MQADAQCGDPLLSVLVLPACQGAGVLVWAITGRRSASRARLAVLACLQAADGGQPAEPVIRDFVAFAAQLLGQRDLAQARPGVPGAGDDAPGGCDELRVMVAGVRIVLVSLVSGCCPRQPWHGAGVLSVDEAGLLLGLRLAEGVRSSAAISVAEMSCRGRVGGIGYGCRDWSGGDEVGDGRVAASAVP